MRFPRSLAIVVSVVAMLCAPHLYAQTTNATVNGLVIDTSGAVVEGATVSAINEDTNVVYPTTTNGAGVYSLTTLPPGRYRVQVTKDGFKNVVKPDIVLNVQDARAVNFTLEVGALSETVTVEAGAPLVNTQSATVSTVVDRQFVENIPLNGRSFQSLIMLTPGVVVSKATFAEQGQFSINGQRANANYYTVDGVSANFGINAGGGTGQAGAGELPALNASGGFSNLVSVDALQEFRIQTSTYAPEFGRTPGGQISLVTRSGTNSFHGSIFDYLRNDVFDATDWFANSHHLTKAKERQNDFGGVFGGPIFRDRTFFFVSYEALRLRQPLVATTQVPSISLRQSAPAAVQTLLNAFPIPNGADQGNGLALFSASYSDPTTLDATSLKLDHQMNKVTVFARYNYAPSNNTTRLAGTQLNNPKPTVFSTGTLTAGISWLVSPTMSNEFRANWSRQDGSTYFYLDTFGGAIPFTTAILPSSVPQTDAFFRATVINAASETLGRNGEGTQRQLNFVDNFSTVRGSHQLKFGVDHRYLFPSAYSRLADLNYTFTSAANVRNSLINTSTAARKSPVDYAYNNFSAYAQDTWRTTPRLTFTYGLRWDVNPAPHGRDSTTIYAANETDNLSAFTFAPAGTPLWQTTYGNVAPRVGAAYRLNDSGTTVARSGFGVFYDMPAGAISNVVILSPNVVTGPSASNVPYPPNASSIVIPPLTTNPPFTNVLVTDPHLKMPYTMQWNLALEHAFDAHQTGTISYIGAAGRRLLRGERYFNASADFPLLQIDRNSGSSDYNALQVQYQRRLSRGFQGLASYTWSHSYDNASNDSTSLPGSDKIDPSAERGPSDFDVRHSFSGALTYDIPMMGPSAANAVFGHWSVDCIFTARSATPVDVTISRDLGFGLFAFRPDVVAGVPLYLDDPTVGGGKRINNTVVGPRQLGPFLVSTDLRQGTLGRNALRGFASNQLNFALRRQVRLTDRFNMQLRGEFFNIFNHPNFADPSGSLGSVSTAGAVTFSAATFGQSPSMLNTSLGSGGQIGGFNPLYGIGGPRSIQLSLRLAF